MSEHPSKHESRQLSDKELRQLLADLDEEITNSDLFPSEFGLAMVVIGGAALALEWDRYTVETSGWCDGTQSRSGAGVLLNVPLDG